MGDWGNHKLVGYGGGLEAKKGFARSRDGVKSLLNNLCSRNVHDSYICENEARVMENIIVEKVLVDRYRGMDAISLTVGKHVKRLPTIQD